MDAGERGREPSGHGGHHDRHGAPVLADRERQRADLDEYREHQGQHAECTEPGIAHRGQGTVLAGAEPVGHIGEPVQVQAPGQPCQGGDSHRSREQRLHRLAGLRYEDP